ncbi:MAG: NapC/NirT family cytochrome c, partial [Nitrospirota bacterium]
MLFKNLKDKLGFKATLLISLPLIFLLSGGGLVYTNRSDFCSSCHTMKGSYSTWKMSSHKEV